MNIVGRGVISKFTDDTDIDVVEDSGEDSLLPWSDDVRQKKAAGI